MRLEPRHLKMGLILFVALATGVAALMLTRKPEPRYRGKGVREWIKELGYINSGRVAQTFKATTPTGTVELAFAPGPRPLSWIRQVDPNAGNTQSVTRVVTFKMGTTNRILLPYNYNPGGSPPMQALRDIGIDSIPYLVKAVSRKDSGLSRLYWRIYPDLPSQVTRYLPVPSVPAIETRRSAVSALGELGLLAKPAVPALLLVARDPDHVVRDRALNALRKLRHLDDEVHAALVGLLSPKRPNAEAVELSRQYQLRGPQVVEALIRAAQDTNASIRRDALETLKDIGPDATSAVPTLARALADSDGGIRYLAARALEEVGPAAKSAIPELGLAVHDTNDMVRTAATRALQKLKSSRESNEP
ncbi:MAG: HEAT repeat domain-containing protein [Verrucomicrobia bacterium]|nr:HEAT repeat domain-containing protein [Verrucomicrobiota bacterium]